MLERSGGAIPAVRLRPIVARAIEGSPVDTKDSLGRRVFKLMHEVDVVSFDFADRLLVDLGLEDAWHVELSDLYEVDDAPAPRVGGTARYLPYEKVIAAYKLYEAGLSSVELGELLWERYGYASADSCRFGLARAFRQFGFKMRTISEARAVLFRNLRCGACGCTGAERTDGCSACRHRHSRRRVAGLSYVAARGCKRCGCSYDERTRGCNACAMRHLRRKVEGRPYVDFYVCAECNCHRDVQTLGCKTCRKRHYSRRWRNKRALAPPSAPQTAAPSEGTPLSETEVAA